jgi:hypothetical protein
VDATPKAYDFGFSETLSDSLTVRLSNLGLQPLTLSNFRVEVVTKEPPPLFGVGFLMTRNTCTSPLPFESTCEVDVEALGYGTFEGFLRWDAIGATGDTEVLIKGHFVPSTGPPGP